MEVVLLHNEKAGAENWSRRKLTNLVADAGYKVRYFPLKRGLEKPELLDRGEFVIVAGGDGAIRRTALAVLGRNRPLAPLPLGTANNIMRSFGLPARPEAIVHGWRKAVRRPFDIGVIEGPWGRRHFFEGVGVGLVSRSIAVIEAIDEIADYEFKKPRQKLHRDVCVAAALAHEMRPLDVHLILDGRELPDAFLLIEVLNIRRAGPGIELAPHASPSDGRFDVVTATARQRDGLLRTLRDRLRDDAPKRSLNTRRARRVQFRITAECDLRIDDHIERVRARTRLDLSLLPGAMEFILPGT